MKQFEKWRSLCVTGLATRLHISAIVIFEKRIHNHGCNFDYMDYFYLCFLWLLEVFERSMV